MVIAHFIIISIKNNKMFSRSLRQRISKLLANTYVFYLRKFRGIDIGNHCNISRRATLDRANPSGAHIGDYSRVMLEALIILMIIIEETEVIFGQIHGLDIIA